MADLRQFVVSYAKNARPAMQGAPASSQLSAPPGARAAATYSDAPVPDAEVACSDKRKDGEPCRAKRVQDSEYCFSHVRNHRGAEPTAD